MKSNYSKIMMFSTVCIVINIVFGTLVGILKIPLIFMDTMGTILAAAIFGPLWGAIVGLLTNVIIGITTLCILINPLQILYHNTTYRTSVRLKSGNSSPTYRGKSLLASDDKSH